MQVALQAETQWFIGIEREADICVRMVVSLVASVKYKIMTICLIKTILVVFVVVGFLTTVGLHVLFSHKYTHFVSLFRKYCIDTVGEHIAERNCEF